MNITEFHGARLNPTNNALKTLVASLVAKTENDILSDSITSAHNAYTLYCVTLLMAATGHRPVLDPFAKKQHLCPSSQLALVSDKVTTAAHKWRICAISSMGATTVNAYNAHLRGLYVRLSTMGNYEPLAHEVHNLIIGKSDSSLPYFFLIDEDLGRTRSITYNHIESYIQPWLPLPPNLFRHAFATWAAAHNIDPALIECQLGHLSSLNHPFGRRSSRSPAAFASSMGPTIDKWMNDLGWQSISGLKPPKRIRDFVSRKYSGRDAHQVHEHSKLGPDLRLHKRNQKIAKDSQVVRQAIAEVLALSSVSEITAVSKEQADAVQRRILELSQDSTERLNHRIRLLWRYWLAMRRRGKNIELSSRISILRVEPTPFAECTLADYCYGQKARTTFIQHLVKRSKDNLSLPTRLAEICVSAALFGFLAQSKCISQLCSLVQLGRYHIVEDAVIVSFSPDKKRIDKQESFYRWIADPLTRGLLIGLHKTISNERQSLTGLKGSNVRSALLNLMNALDLPVKGAKKAHSELARLGAALATIELPPILRETATGSLSYQPLPLTTLARLATRKRLAEVLPEIENIESELASALIDCDATIRPDSGKKVRHITKAIRRAITDIRNLPAFGHNKKKGFQKRELIKRLKKTIPARGIPPLAAAIYSWTLSLCTHGTRQYSNITFSTIERYVYEVTKGLPLIAGDKDFFRLTALEYEEIYIQALDYTTDANRNYNGRRLREFHRYLTTQHPLNEPEWAAIVGSDNDNYVDANLICFDEYQRCLQLLGSCRAIDELDRISSQGLLVLGFRFGLRIDEALRIKPADIQFAGDDKDIIVLIRSSIYGNTKSLAGVRQIPLFGSLIPVELHALTTLINLANGRISEDKQVGLFSDRRDSRRLVSHAVIVQQAMRQVAGDPSMIYHHLRHSFANRLGLLHTNETENKFSKKTLSRLWGDIPSTHGVLGSSDRRLESLSSAIGHARPATTYASYLHLFELELAEHYESAQLGSLTDSGVQYVLQVSASTPRVSRKRAGLKASESWKLLQIAAFKHQPEWAVSLNKHPASEKLNLEMPKYEQYAHPVEVDRLLINVAKMGAVADGAEVPLRISRTTLIEIIDQARKAEKLICNIVYDLPLNAASWWEADHQVTRNEPFSGLATETKRIRLLLNVFWSKYIQLNEAKQKETINGIDAALKMFSQGQGTMLAANADQLSDFVLMVSNLTIGIDRFVAILPDDIPAQRSAELKSQVKTMGFTLVNVAKLPLINSVDDDRRKQRIRIKPSRDSGGIFSEKALRRIIIVLSSILGSGTTEP